MAKDDNKKEKEEGGECAICGKNHGEEVAAIHAVETKLGLSISMHGPTNSLYGITMAILRSVLLETDAKVIKTSDRNEASEIMKAMTAKSMKGWD